MYVIMIYSKNLYDTFVGNVSVDIPVDIALDIVSNGYYLDKRDMENIIPYIDSRYMFCVDFVKYRYKLTDKPEYEKVIVKYNPENHCDEEHILLNATLDQLHMLFEPYNSDPVMNLLYRITQVESEKLRRFIPEKYKFDFGKYYYGIETFKAIQSIDNKIRRRIMVYDSYCENNFVANIEIALSKDILQTIFKAKRNDANIERDYEIREKEAILLGKYINSQFDFKFNFKRFNYVLSAYPEFERTIEVYKKEGTHYDSVLLNIPFELLETIYSGFRVKKDPCMYEVYEIKESESHLFLKYMNEPFKFNMNKYSYEIEVTTLRFGWCE